MKITPSRSPGGCVREKTYVGVSRSGGLYVPPLRPTATSSVLRPMTMVSTEANKRVNPAVPSLVMTK